MLRNVQIHEMTSFVLLTNATLWAHPCAQAEVPEGGPAE